MAKFEVLGIGNAIVDVLGTTDDSFLNRKAIVKGAMNLIDEPRAEDLYGEMARATIISGGSAANTMVGIANLGGRAAYIGKVKADPVGEIFTYDLRATGVAFDVPAAQEGPASARSFIFVTPDGERSMNTYLGACQNLAPEDIEPDLVQGSAITYLEGYLWDKPAAKQAFLKASALAHAAGNRVAITLSDSFCVERFRPEFLELIRSKAVDIVFANEAELTSLYETTNFDGALRAAAQENILAVVTRSELGAIVLDGGTRTVVPAFPIRALVDSTGAGDLFAAGFLAGLVRGKAHDFSARLGALAAAEIIQHIGARPQSDLRALSAQHGLLL
eukprot:gene10059-10128_t